MVCNYHSGWSLVNQVEKFASCKMQIVKTVLSMEFYVLVNWTIAICDAFCSMSERDTVRLGNDLNFLITLIVITIETLFEFYFSIFWHFVWRFELLWRFSCARRNLRWRDIAKIIVDRNCGQRGSVLAYGSVELNCLVLHWGLWWSSRSTLLYKFWNFERDEKKAEWNLRSIFWSIQIML